MTKKARRAAALVLALLLVLAGALLLRRGTDRDGVRVESLVLDGVPFRLYRLGEGSGETVILTDHADGDGGHTHALTLGGQSSLALILSAGHDRADALATELARRGVTAAVLAAPGAGLPVWEYLAGREDVRLSAMALVASPDRAGEALALMETLSGSGRESAAAVLMEDAGLLGAASASPGRNILFLSTGEPDPDGVEAFLRETERSPGWIGGYFAEGTARKVVRDVSGRWDEKSALLPVIDWLGSSLGHTIELKDEDLIVPGQTACHTWAVVCLVLAIPALAGAALPRRKDYSERENDG